MKKLSFLNKLLFFANSLLATLLLLSIFLPKISPEVIPAIAIVSLLVPFLIIFNLLFIIYWIVQLKKQFLLSSIVVTIFWCFSPTIYKFSKEKNETLSGLNIMSYNVKMFNHWKWKKEDAIPKKISEFIQKEKPEVILFQEFYKKDSLTINYPYKYIKTKNSKDNAGLAIFSKYEIMNSGSFNFKDTFNNIIYADILVKEDTIRFYNVHLQSLQINLLQSNFGEKNSTKLISRLENGFIKQAQQTNELHLHEKKWQGKKIIGGDFNNTSYSWVYNTLIQNKKDAFLEAGSGFGKSYDYQFPLRIDFILTDNNAKIHSYSSKKVKYSDHFPIQTIVSW